MSRSVPAANKQAPPLVEALLWSVYWLFLGILVLLPVDGYLAFRSSAGGVFISQLIAIETSIVLLIYLVASLYARYYNMAALTWKSVAPLIVLFLVAIGASIHAFSPSTALREALKIVVYLGIFALGALVRALPNARRNTLIALVVGLGIVTLVALLTFNGKLPDIVGLLLNIQHSPAKLPFSSTVRFESTFRYPNELAAYLLIVLPVLLAHAVTTTERRLRVVLIVALLAGLWMLVFTYTRGALLAGIAVAVVMLAILGGWRMASAAIICLSMAVVAITLRGGALSARLVSVLSGTDTAYQSRDVVRQWAWDTFVHHPILGIGLGNLKLLPNAPYLVPALGLHAIDAENMYLNVLAEMGILGALAFAVALGSALVRLWQGVRSKSKAVSTWNIGVAGSLIALMLYGLADPIVVSGQVVGLLCAVIGLAGVLEMPVLAPAGEQTKGQVAPVTSGGHTPTNASTQARRVVFLVNAPGFGGAGQHALNIAGGMRARGTDVLIVAPPGSGTLARAQTMGLSVKSLRLGANLGRGKGVLGVLAFRNPFSTTLAKQRILALDRETPSLFVCPFPREQILTARLNRSDGVRAIWVVHAPFRYAAHRLFIQRAWVRAANRAMAVVPVSARLGADLKHQKIPLSRLQVIPNSVAIPPSDVADIDTRTPYLIGTASRLVKAKGIQYMIAAMPDVVARFPQARLAIAGTGKYEPELRAQVQRLGLTAQVDFLGQLDDLLPFYRSLHVFVHPTVDPGEVLPTAILEAASTGTPVVASSLASIPDEVRDGLTGFLTPPADAIAIAASVNTLLGDPVTARAMGNAGRYLVAQEFPLDRAVASFLTLSREATDSDDGTISKITTMPKAVIRRKALVGNSAIMLISKVLTAIATATWTVLAARTLLPADYGNLALASSLVDLFTFLSDIGINAVATRELATAPSPDMRRLLGTVTYLKFFLGLIGSAIVIGITALLPFHAGVFRIMLVLGPSLLFTSIYSLTLVFRARASYTQLLIVSLVVSLIGIGSALAVSFFNGDAIAFAGVQTATQIGAGLLTLLLCLIIFKPDLRLHLRDLGKLFMVAVPVGLALAVNILYYRIDVPLLGLLSSSEEVAKYSSTYRFLDVLTLLPASLQAATLPQMAVFFKRNVAELREFAQQYLEIAVSLGLFIGLLLSYSAHSALDILYAQRYDAATPTLQILAWAGAATLVTNVFVPLTVTLNKTRGLFVTSAIGLLVNVGINVILIPRLGSVAAAYATLITEGVVILCLTWIATRALHWRIHVLKLAGVGAVTAVAAWASQTAFFQTLAWPIGVLVLAFGWLILALPLILVKRRFFAFILKR